MRRLRLIVFSLSAFALLAPPLAGAAARPCRPDGFAQAPRGRLAPTYVLSGPIVRGEARQFENWIAQAKAADADHLPIIITSNGGDAREALMMAHALRGSGLPSRCEVRGLAGSSAFLLLQACSTRVAEQSARLVTHQPQARLSMTVTLEKAQRLVSQLEALTNEWDRLIAERMGLPLERYRSQVTGGRDWAMTSRAALAASAIDGILPDRGLRMAQR